MNYLAVDPGETTGWITYTNGRAVVGQHGFMPFMTWADIFLEGMNDLTVVCERYVITPRSGKMDRGDVNWSIETIGCLRYLCDKHDHRFVLQNASDAKEFGTDELLQYLDWYPVRWEHARDAARHLARFMSIDEPRLWAVMTARYLRDL